MAAPPGTSSLPFARPVWRFFRGAAALVLGGLLLSGCATWTTTEKDDLLEDMRKLKGDMRRLKGPTSGGGGIRDQLAELTNRVGGLEGKLAQLGGVDEDLNYRLSQLEGTLSPTQPGYPSSGAAGPGQSPYGYSGSGQAGWPRTEGDQPTPGVLPSAPTQDAFDQAMRARQDQRFKESVTFFDTFIRENPRSPKLEEAYFYKGEAQFAQAESQRDDKTYEEAILTFDKFRHDFPKSKHLPACLLKQGLSFKALGWPSDARLFLNDVVRRYPNSTEAAQARQELGAL